MKIAVIGNMNNMYFSLTRYLIDHGYDCKQLIFNNEPPHFHPSFDTYHTDYKEYCHHLSWGAPSEFLKQDIKQVELDLKDYDFLIGSGTAPAFVNRIGRKLDIFIPYGEDLVHFPFLRLVHPIRIPGYLTTAYYQRRGIKEAVNIIFDKSHQKIEQILFKLKYTGMRIVSPPPLLYYKEYEGANLQMSKSLNPYYNQLQKIRTENELIILQHIRQVWKPTRDNWGLKGNDKLVKGYTKFVKTHPEVKTKLILFEYGVHVSHTKQLIESLQIEEHVIWFPKMPRKYIMHFISSCDVVVGELHHSWLTYCGVLESLCMGKPIMHKRIDEYYIPYYPELYPMLHADSSETVFNGLKKFISNKLKMQEVGSEGKDWFLKYCVQKPIQEVLKIINTRHCTHSYPV